jgi:hypothetical protein
MTIQLRCNLCGKVVSSAVPNETVVRAWLECPECIEKQPDLERENTYLKQRIKELEDMYEVFGE